MTAKENLTPSGSQTVGPFFHIGLQYMLDLESVAPAAPGAIEIRGKVIDGNGNPVPDAMLEFWSAENLTDGAELGSNGLPSGFRRTVTDADGSYSTTMNKPGPVPIGDGSSQAPHFFVMVFARGLLRQLVTRVYFANESANDADSVLRQISAERRHTLIARADANRATVFHWDVVLQGTNETAFFAW
ncbi:MAG TPA: protocatechuate 3,4-dioxygenase subunit alpha [Terriglobales bacterium]|nr:protocatechuate 3,4-dioxygenase subunit alpha [Terriglobales bacterium]